MRTLSVLMIFLLLPYPYLPNYLLENSTKNYT